jgi:predicted DNA-binding transcriptional regulator AlpA
MQQKKSLAHIKRQPSRFIFRPEVLDRVGVTYVTIWQWMRDGTFPASRDVDGQVAWYEHEIDTWIASRPIRKYKPLNKRARG